MSALRAIILAIVVFLPCLPAHADAGMRVETVIVVTDKGEFPFKTEIADTHQARQTGLMYRKTMAPEQAMLFDWGEPVMASMWMANTFVSFDMLFIAGDGTVKFIAQNTVPQSREVISANMTVAAVLEVVAGTAARIGLKPGDKVKHSMFDH